MKYIRVGVIIYGSNSNLTLDRVAGSDCGAVAAVARISDPREIVNRLIEGLTSSLGVVVFDNRLVDSSVVDNLIKISGIDQIIDKYYEKNLIIYTININKIEFLCKKVECGGVGAEKLRPCLSSCIIDKIKEIKIKIKNDLIEAVNSIG